MSTLTLPSVDQTAPAWGSLLAKLILVSALYLIGAEAAFLVGTLSDRIFAPFWPPNVVLFCAFLLAPPRTWWLYLLAVFPAHVIVELGVGMPFPQLMVAFATNAAVALISARASIRLLGPLPWFDDLGKTCLYVAITAAAAPAVVALGGAFVPILGGGSIQHYWSFWAQWLVSNAVSSLALGPLVLAWLGDRTPPASRFSTRMLAEALLLAGGLFLVSAVAFESGKSALDDALLPALLYLPLPFILWSAIRFGAKGASGAILIVAVALMWRVLNGPSPFMADTPEQSVFAIQAFLIGLSIPVLLLGAAIEETRRAERAVRKSEERMALAAVAADVCLWHFDYDSEQFWMTDHGRKMLGFSADQPLTKQAMIEAVHPEDRESVRASIKSAAVSEEPVDIEFRVVPAAGQVRWIRARASADRKQHGRNTKISGTFTNITCQKAAESELAQQRHDLAHLMRVSMLGELSGSIAHELTQPLTAILSNAQAARLMMTGGKPNFAEVIEVIDDIIAEDNRAGEVIHHLRKMLKKGESKFEQIDFNDLISYTLRLLHSEFVARRIKCRCDLAEGIPSMSGDPVQLQQVLLNLIMNAIEAMNEVPPSRRIMTIRTRPLEGDKLCIDISDHGTGLASANGEKLFEPFFTTKERGLGLGLSICSSIIKLHGGTLYLENNPKEGATAVLVMPGRHSRIVEGSAS